MSKQSKEEDWKKRIGHLETNYGKMKAQVKLLTRRIQIVDGDLLALQDAINLKTKSKSGTETFAFEENEDTKTNINSIGDVQAKEEEEEEEEKAEDIVDEGYYTEFLGIDFKNGMKKKEVHEHLEESTEQEGEK